MVSERKTDDLVRDLLKDAEIDYDEQISHNPTINKALDGATKSIKSKSGENKGFPEFIAKSGEFVIVIEDKKESTKQALYIHDNPDKLDMSTEKAIKQYAENGALHYARHIVKNSPYKKVFAFGCSGTDYFTIKPIFVDETGYVILEEVNNFENFNENNIEEYYREKVLNLPSIEEIQLKTLIDKSKELHEDLRNYGQLEDNYKPIVVSAILLALDEKSNLVDDLTGDDAETDGEKIYRKVDANLKRSGVKNKSIILDEFKIICKDPTLNTINEKIDETPLKKFVRFINEEIFPEIRNISADVLGYFYGEFIKYSGGDGKSLGIVLTPKHITELFCELLEIKSTDKILDPCCGTGSFLISGMNQMIQQANDEETINNIKMNNIHGIEKRARLFSIATTNMILHGDGKTNLILDDFFNFKVEDLRKNEYTVGLMNPPYSQSKNEETSELSEMNFISHLLDSLADNARCAVIVPQSVMSGKKDDKPLKKSILKKHTLEGVISLNNDTTFYRKNVHPCIAIFTAHVPHRNEKLCKFINFTDDGYELRKHIGITKTERANDRKKYLLRCWRGDDENYESNFMIKTRIKDDDEWLHAYYYFNEEIPTEDIFKETMEEYIGFEFEMILKDKTYLFKE